MNALRLLFGTLTILPVQAPTSVDRRTAGWAMTLAPLVGVKLAFLVAGSLALAEAYADPPPLLAAVLCIGALAVLTRAIHLDGLADTADGLGSGRRGDAGLAVMKRSDIGPFGVVTLVLVLLAQVAALASCIAGGFGAAALAAALVWSRVTVTGLSVRMPAGPTDGLGSLVAGTVSRAQHLLGVALALAATAGILAMRPGFDGLAPRDLGQVSMPVVLLCVLAPLAGSGLAAHAVRRFGGVTGDVYGAAVETTFTAVLLAATLL